MTPSQFDLSRALWRKSSRSTGDDATCVEVARNIPGVVAVRDSENPGLAALVFSPGEWRTFTAALRLR